MKKTFPFSICKKIFILTLLILSIFACNNSEDDNTENGDSGLYDPYSSLRSKVGNNAIYCDEEACCWDDCQYDQVVCGQQKGLYDAVGSNIDNYNLDSAPDWWTEELFYLVSDYEMNVISERTDSFSASLFYIAKYCESGEFHTAYTNLDSFANSDAFTTYLNSGPPSYNCTTALNYCSGFCTSNCSGLQCGSDGCGGNCGTCASGEICNSSGQCVSDGGGASACDTCLSSCRGLPGCCTGCGCICESACGMCF